MDSTTIIILVVVLAVVGYFAYTNMDKIKDFFKDKMPSIAGFSKDMIGMGQNKCSCCAN